MTRKCGKHCARHTETLDSCFNLIRSHQQCIPRYHGDRINDHRTENQPLSQWSTLHTSYIKLTSHEVDHGILS